jgi:hypothetical protein
MENIKKRYHFIPFGELDYAVVPGILCQRDIVQFNYDDHYFDHYLGLEDTEIAVAINKARKELTEKYVDSILDVGIGSGEFIKKSTIKCWGYDINPMGVKWLKKQKCFLDPYKKGIPDHIKGVTLWDALEHMPNPTEFLSLIKEGMFVFISMPIFDNLLKVRSSKHYKPHEHLTYWTTAGLVCYMMDLGFSLKEISDKETVAGREGILTFAFKKDREGILTFAFKKGG